MVVHKPDVHGLPGYLEHVGHIVDELSVLTAPAELVEAPLDLGDGHEDSGAQHIGLHLHVALGRLRQQRRAFPCAGVQPLVENPVGQLMGAGKPQTAGVGVLITEGSVNEDRPGADREEDVLLVLHVIHRLQTTVKNGFAQNAAILPEILILQRHSMGLDDLLDGDSGGGTLIQRGVIAAQHLTGDIF